MARITPLISVSDINGSIDFYVHTLGFKVGYQSAEYAFLHRDAIAVRLLQTSEGRQETSRQKFYIDVEGLDDLYESLKEELIQLPKGRVKIPFEQFYGQREFHVVDEDRVLLMFGESVK